MHLWVFKKNIKPAKGYLASLNWFHVLALYFFVLGMCVVIHSWASLFTTNISISSSIVKYQARPSLSWWLGARKTANEVMLMFQRKTRSTVCTQCFMFKIARCILLSIDWLPAWTIRFALHWRSFIQLLRIWEEVEHHNASGSIRNSTCWKHWSTRSCEAAEQPLHVDSMMLPRMVDSACLKCSIYTQSCYWPDSS